MGSGVGWNLPHHSAPKKLTTCRQQPTSGIFRFSRRARAAIVALRLVTIHPNPGPTSRDKTEEGKRKRRERRYGRRKEKAETKKEQARRANEEVKELTVVTWNVQRMSLGSRRKVKARKVAEYARRSGWDVVLLSEVRGEGSGVVWMGEEEERVVFVHSERAAVMLRGEVMKAWCEEGMTKKMSKRTVSVKVKGVMLTATYQPVSENGNEEEVETELEVLAEHVKWAKGDELVVVGGDFNAHVGGGSEKKGVSGKFGLRESNRQGRRLLEWCEANGLSHVNSFFNHRQRGTWFSNIFKRWYEIDGFLMRNRERQQHVRKLCTIGEAALSDHKPKKLRVELKKKRWRKPIQRKKTPRIKWEMLQVEEVAVAYGRRLEERLGEEEEERRIDMTGWVNLAEVVVEVAAEVCGLKEKSVENPWMIGREEESAELRRRISSAVTSRNTAVEMERQGEIGEEEVEEAKERLKEVRGGLDSPKYLKNKNVRWSGMQGNAVGVNVKRANWLRGKEE